EGRRVGGEDMASGVDAECDCGTSERCGLVCASFGFEALLVAPGLLSFGHLDDLPDGLVPCEGDDFVGLGFSGSDTADPPADVGSVEVVLVVVAERLGGCVEPAEHFWLLPAVV